MKSATGMLIGLVMLAAFPLMVVTNYGPLVWIGIMGVPILVLSFVWSFFEK